MRHPGPPRGYQNVLSTCPGPALTPQRPRRPVERSVNGVAATVDNCWKSSVCTQDGATFSGSYGTLPSCTSPTPHWNGGPGVIMSYCREPAAWEMPVACMKKKYYFGLWLLRLQDMPRGVQTCRTLRLPPRRPGWRLRCCGDDIWRACRQRPEPHMRCVRRHCIVYRSARGCRTSPAHSPQREGTHPDRSARLPLSPPAALPACLAPLPARRRGAGTCG